MCRFDDLVALDLRPLSEVLAGRVPSVSELEPRQWLGVVELLTMRLAGESGDLSAEAWTTCSSALSYTLDAALAAGSFDHRESVVRRLNLSSAVLREVPPNAEIDILNPDCLIGLLFQELPMSAEEARDLSVDWRALDIAQIRRLHAVKNLVTPALDLASMVSGEEFRRRLMLWREVLPLLP